MNQSDYIDISGLQHFVFCKRQWALIHIENQWEENYLSAEGRVLHDRVHDAEDTDTRNGIVTMRGLRVRSDTLGVTGICDAVEFIPAEEGIVLSGRQGCWRVHPVEYKRGTFKVSDCDRMQVALQAMCLEEMLCCDILYGSLFYFQPRRREKIELTEALRTEVKETVQEMHKLYTQRYTPRVRQTRSCKSCSLAEVCLPELLSSSSVSASDYIKAKLKD